MMHRAELKKSGVAIRPQMTLRKDVPYLKMCYEVEVFGFVDKTKRSLERIFEKINSF